MRTARPGAGSLYAAGMLLALAIGPRNFLTNDDVAMNALASGAFTGEPDARWVFTGPLISVPISALYRAAGDVPWYALTYYCLQLLAGAMLVRVLVRKGSGRATPAIAVAIASLAIVQHWLLTFLSFTGTAFILALAAVAWVLDDESDRRDAVIALALLFAATTIRSDAVIGLVAVATPALLLSRRPRAIAAFAGSALTAFTANAILTRLLFGSDYREFLEYDELRGSLHATPRVSAEAMSPELLQAVNWTGVDRGMFVWFLHDDPSRFSATQLETIAAGTEAARLPFDLDAFLDIVALRYPTLLIALGVILFVHARGPRPSRAAVAAAVTVIGVGAMTWLWLTQRLPSRVALPLWLSLIVVAALAPAARATDAEPSNAKPRRATVRIGLACAAGLLIVTVVFTDLDPRRTRLIASDFQRANAELEILIEGADQTPIVAYGGALVVEGGDPLNGPTSFEPARHLPLGWWVFSPMFEDRKDGAGVEAPLLAPLIDEDARFLGPERVAAYYAPYLTREAGEGALVKDRCSALVPDTCVWRYERDTNP